MIWSVYWVLLTPNIHGSVTVECQICNVICISRSGWVVLCHYLWLSLRFLLFRVWSLWTSTSMQISIQTELCSTIIHSPTISFVLTIDARAAIQQLYWLLVVANLLLASRVTRVTCTVAVLMCLSILRMVTFSSGWSLVGLCFIIGWTLWLDSR